MLSILADENIPAVEALFGQLGAVETLPGRSITSSATASADVLLVRSVTRIDAQLLATSAVRFVGSATIGTDHVDTGYLEERGIAFAHAPGANADSVVEYVQAALLALAVRHQSPLRGKVVGVVGCGNIGGRLVRCLPAFGVRVLVCDPPLAEQADARGESHGFVSLDCLLGEADVLTLHVPLTRQGAYPTYHMIGRRALEKVGQGLWLVNTSRGAVVSGRALHGWLRRDPSAIAVLDVWEGEPSPTPSLVDRAALATPHVAGYSYDGKVAGTRMLYEALIDHLAREDPAFTPPPSPVPVVEAHGASHLDLVPPDPTLPEMDWLHTVARRMYDVVADDTTFRKILALPQDERPAYFARLRKEYPRRRAFALHGMPYAMVPPRFCEAVRDGLGLQDRVAPR